MQCKRHPIVETNLACGKCGDPICPRCMVQTPVGARCPSCARMSRLPTYNVSGLYYLRAAGAGLGIGIVGGVAWGFLSQIIFSSYFNLIIAGALGYAIGEVISLSVNRKRGIGLAAIGGAAVVLSYAIGAFTFWGFSFNLFDLLALGIGIFVSSTRLR